MNRRWGGWLALVLVTIGCAEEPLVPPIQVLSVEFERLYGVWFDIAHLPHEISEFCSNTRSLFSESDADSMTFIFECQHPDLFWYHVSGRVVRHPDDSDHFVFEFDDNPLDVIPRLSFWVLEADWEAGWVCLGNPKEGWFWLWARDSEFDYVLRETLLDDIEERGLYPALRQEMEYTDHF